MNGARGRAQRGRELSYDLVVPTAGRPSLRRLLESLAGGEGALPGRVLVVDDRRVRSEPLLGGVGELGELGERVAVLSGPAVGPAAARNAGWRASRADWVIFLDDDVAPDAGWRRALEADLAELGSEVGASQGRLRVPLPTARRPTDWERNVAGLERARWATADMAYRRAALQAVGGFDERFPRAYREDADLGLRVLAAGWTIVRGERRSVHPVGPASRGVSLRLQAGNADDVLMRALHGRAWRSAAGVPAGRRPRHLATTGAGAASLVALAHGRRRTAALGAAAWLAGTAELAFARIAPGPRTPDELLTLALTSAVLPAAASAWWLAGHVRHAPLLAGRALGRRPSAARRAPEAVLLDRDGTLIVDVPYNGDPDRVVPVRGARAALDRLRARGMPLAMVSNQSGVGRGLVSEEQVEAVNRRVEALVGPLAHWAVCPHAPDAGCDCRKPAPGLVVGAAAALGVAPERCAVVGDIGADVEAARAAGARAVLVPTARTRRQEIEAAPEVAPDLETAVELLIGARP